MPTTLAVLDDWVTAAELAALAGIALQTLYNWSSQGKTPPRYRRGRGVAFKRADVEPWLERLASPL